MTTMTCPPCARVELIDGVAVCSPRGPRLGGRDAARLAAELIDELPFARLALLDLSGVVLADGSGLLALAGLARDCRQAGLEFAVCGATPSVRRLLAAVGLHASLDVYACREQALSVLRDAA